MILKKLPRRNIFEIKQTFGMLTSWRQHPQDTNCTATWLLSRKLFKLDEPDMQDTAGEAGTNS